MADKQGAACPQCGEVITPKPTRARKCPHCGVQLVVRQFQVMTKEQADAPPAFRSFDTYVSGVTFKNSDGSSRQDVIIDCKPKEQLQLIRDRENPRDRNAIKVCRANGDQLGFLSGEVAAKCAPRIEKGYIYVAFVKNIEEFERNERPMLGMNILVVAASPGVDVAGAWAYVESLGMKDWDAGGGGCMVLLAVIGAATWAVLAAAGLCS